MKKKLAEVEIHKLRLRTIIGFKDWEREKLQDVVITIRFKYDAAEAARTDRVEHAVDYKTITKKVIRFVEESKFFLIEALAENIYQIVHAFDGVEAACVVVEKPNALRFCDNVMVKISDYDE